jgi:hypothetical protein
VALLILSLQARINLQRISTCRYDSRIGTTQAAITVIASCRAPLQHTFAAVSTTLTVHSTTKCFLTLKTRLRFLKSEGPLNFKKMPIGTRGNRKLSIDVPLLTHVSFCCTVPLNDRQKKFTDTFKFLFNVRRKDTLFKTEMFVYKTVYVLSMIYSSCNSTANSPFWNH